jgi:chemotaxis protein methyltransferase WspC
MNRIEHRLRLGMGLDATSIGSSCLQRIIRLRMKTAGVASVEDYEHLIAVSTAEWNQLVEAVVVTETWFYRDRQAFVALATLILTDWMPSHATGQVRILSLPCSSGEEPYSIVMALIDAGIPSPRFTVDAVDLSHRALEKAVAAAYGRNSFRGQDLAFRDRYFNRAGDLYSVKQSIRNCITFRQANLLGDDFVLQGGRYDYIFCRNLLIYFDRETQRHAFRRLESLLAPDGVLFLGPAEVPLAMANGFSSVNMPMAFACRRTPATAFARSVFASTQPRRATGTVPVLVNATAKSGRDKPTTAVGETANSGTLISAREHADNGRLQDAVRLCRAHLDEHGASVDAFYLLGVIHDAMGHPDARDFYRKALYLDPNHCESLLQMAFLAEREGDSTAARNLRRRAQKQQPRTA